MQEVSREYNAGEDNTRKWWVHDVSQNDSEEGEEERDGTRQDRWSRQREGSTVVAGVGVVVTVVVVPS